MPVVRYILLFLLSNIIKMMVVLAYKKWLWYATQSRTMQNQVATIHHFDIRCVSKKEEEMTGLRLKKEEEEMTGLGCC